jgi:hypothetical protein
MTEDGLDAMFFSIDERRLRGILNPLKQGMNYHPILKQWEVDAKFHPEIKFYSPKNNWSLLAVNMTLKGEAPGDQFYQIHAEKAWGEEVSFETEEVYKKRRDSGSEKGCIERFAGMTNFTRLSPAGKIFFDPKKKKKVLNLPRYCNPYWNDAEKQKAIDDFGGIDSINYEVFVEGEVVENSETEVDMDRVVPCFHKEKTITRIELKKDQYKRFKDLLVLARPKNAERIFIAADIGESAGTDITIFSEVGETYNWIYNIVLYNYKLEEQFEVFKYIIESLQANVIGIDCGDAFGRNLSDQLENKYGQEHIVRYQGATKIKTGFALDENDKVKTDDKGNPLFKEEFMAEWSVNHLKTLLYGTRFHLPSDAKLENQLTYIISTFSGDKKIYACTSETGDHLFSSFKVMATCVWLKKDFNQTPNITDYSNWGTGTNSWTK